MIREGIAQAVERRSLSSEMASAIMAEMMSGAATPAQIGSFITAMRMKGETEEELLGFAQAMRRGGAKITAPAGAVDLCGTGGDGSGTFNISTVASFVVAAAGVPVAKHGNRSVSSSSGSADLLDSLGIPYDLGPREVQECLTSTGYGFMFAPVFHASMRNVLAPRREVGLRTFFNLLGPMSNPAGVKSQLMGVYDINLVGKIAGVLGKLSVDRAMVVHGSGMDEITNTGSTHVAELREGKVAEHDLRPSDFGFDLAEPDQLAGHSPAHSARAAISVLKGERSPRREVVLMNAGAALYVAGAAQDLHEGIALAEEAIDSGKAMRKLRQIADFSLSKERDRQQSAEVGSLVGRKLQPEVLRVRCAELTEQLVKKISDLRDGPEAMEPLDPDIISRPNVLSVISLTRVLSLSSDRANDTLSGRQSTESFSERLSSPGLSIIGEYKPRAPSRASLSPPPDAKLAASIYEQTGMAAVSVLVENVFFGGSPELFAQFRASVRSPMLFKDFVVSEKQLELARGLGADAVLLISKALRADALDMFVRRSQELNLEPVVEVHDANDVEKLEAMGSGRFVKVVGVNSRDLTSLRLDLGGMQAVRRRLSRDKLVIAESGIRSGKDLLSLKGFDGVLVGSALMEAEDFAGKARELVAFGRRVAS
jgi:anthranilate phosphoribosyltransferase